MINKKYSKKINLFALLYIVPIITLFLIANCKHQVKYIYTSDISDEQQSLDKSERIVDVYGIPDIYKPKFQGSTNVSKFFPVWVMGESYKYSSDELNQKREKIHGLMIVSFVVDTSGRVKNAEIVKSIEPMLDKAVLTAIINSPLWEPGKAITDNTGEFKPANIGYTLSLSF